MDRMLREHRRLTIAMCGVAVIIRFWVGAYTTDDAYITFRYSENLVAGRGFTYNPPERVQGTTAPLAALLLTAPAALHADLGTTMLVVSAAADVVTILCGVSMLTRAGWPLAGLLFAAAVACWPGFVRYSVSGLETSLYVSLLMLSGLCAERGRAVATGFVLALASLCRPDGALLAIILLPIMAGRSISDAVRALTAYVCTLAPWGLFALLYFHTVIPASVTAKAHTRLPAPESLRALVAQFWGGLYTLLTPVALAGLIVLARRASRIFVALGLWWVAYAVIFTVTGAFGPYPWYFVPLLPVYFAGIGAAVEASLRWLWRPVLPAQAAVACVFAAAIVLGSRIPAMKATLEGWFAGREFLYRFVAETVTTRQDCTLAASEIGAIGYYYRGRILDLVGLVSPEVTRQPLADIFESQTPCWVVSYDTHLPPDLTRAAAFTDHYTIVHRQRVGAERELLVYVRK